MLGGWLRGFDQRRIVLREYPPFYPLAGICTIPDRGAQVIKLVARCWELQMKRTERDVLLVMCDTADERGICWPSIEYIAWAIDANERTVRRTVDDLQRAGVLTLIDPRHYPGRSRRYQIDLSGLPEKPAWEPNRAKRTPVKMSGVEMTNTGQNVHSTPDISGITPDIAMSGEPSVEPPVENDTVPNGTGEPMASPSPLIVIDPKLGLRGTMISVYDAAENKPGALGLIFRSLFGAEPNHGRIARMWAQTGKGTALVVLMLDLASKPIAGDPLNMLAKMAKREAHDAKLTVSNTADRGGYDNFFGTNGGDD